MPELPEVETVVRELRPRLTGRRITAVTVSKRPLRRRWLARWRAGLTGRRVEEVRRRGKWILICLEGNRHLLIHLGMTGQLMVVPTITPRADHTHVICRLDDGSRELRFRDVRRFGSITFFQNPEALQEFFIETGLGPEPFDLDSGYLRDRLKATRRCLKAVLLDQQVLAGVGNIYADESLWEARLHPARFGQEITSGEVRRLHRAIVKVLNRAIQKRGSSIRDYIGGSGERGGYQEEFRVYSRTGKPCERCRTAIACIRLAGRSTHFCPRCQKLSEKGSVRNGSDPLLRRTAVRSGKPNVVSSL